MSEPISLFPKPPLFKRRNRSVACGNDRHDHCLAWGCGCWCHTDGIDVWWCPVHSSYVGMAEDSPGTCVLFDAILECRPKRGRVVT